MRTNKRALVALDTVVRLPARRFDADAAFFPGSDAQRIAAILTAVECTYRQLVAFLPVHRNHHFLDELRHRLADFRFIRSRFPGLWNLNPSELRNPPVDRSNVAFDHRLALFGIGIRDCLLHVFYSVGQRNDRCQFEKRRLHNAVDPPAQTQFLCDCDCIDPIEFDLLFGEHPFHGCRQSRFQLGCVPLAVEQKDSTWL